MATTRAATDQHADDLAGLDPVERRIIECRRKFGDNAQFSWLVHRIAANGAESLCEPIHGVEFDEHAFRERWGAGNYRRRLRCKGQRAHLAQEDFALESLPGAPEPTHAPRPEQPPQPTPQAIAPPAPMGGESMLSTMFAMMMQQQQQQAQQAQAQQQSQTQMMIEMMRTSSRTPVADLVDLMGVVKKTAQDEGGGDDSIAATVAPMLAALGQAQGAAQGAGQPIDQTTAALVQQLAAVGVTTPQQLAQVVGLARAGKIAQARAAIAQQARPAPAPIDPDTTPLNGQALPTAPDDDDQGDADDTADDQGDGLDLADAAGVLMMGARAQGDPTVYAMMIADAIDDQADGGCEAVLSMLPPGGVVAFVVDLFPDATDDQRQWLAQVERALRAMTFPPEQAAYTEATTPAPDDPGDDPDQITMFDDQGDADDQQEGTTDAA